MSDNITFTRDIIKGRIAETIFQQMVLEAGKFDPVPLGYEHSLPQLAHKAKYNARINEITGQLRHTPDFALIEESGDEVYLVEVKYFDKFDNDEIVDKAKNLLNNWKHSWLFIATPDGFYMDFCSDIKVNEKMENKIEKFGITYDMQRKYLEILKAFIPTGSR
jgi:hypothetical protein